VELDQGEGGQAALGGDAPGGRGHRFKEGRGHRWRREESELEAEQRLLIQEPVHLLLRQKKEKHLIIYMLYMHVELKALNNIHPLHAC